MLPLSSPIPSHDHHHQKEMKKKKMSVYLNNVLVVSQAIFVFDFSMHTLLLLYFLLVPHRISEELAKEMLEIEKQKLAQSREIEKIKNQIMHQNIDMKILSEKILDMRVSLLPIWVLVASLYYLFLLSFEIC